MSQVSSALHDGSTMPGYDLSVTRAAVMSGTVTDPSKSSLLMLDDLNMSGSALKVASPTAYTNANLTKDFINSKVLFHIVIFVHMWVVAAMLQNCTVVLYSESELLSVILIQSSNHFVVVICGILLSATSPHDNSNEPTFTTCAIPSGPKNQPPILTQLSYFDVEL